LAPKKEEIMEDKKQYRRFFTDPDYRLGIEESAKNDLKWRVRELKEPYEEEAKDENGFPYPSPCIDQADAVARAIISDLRNRGGGIDDAIGNFDLEAQTQLKDVAAEIVRQGMASEVYERPAIDHPPPFVYHDEKWPYFDDNEIRSSGETYTPHEVRQQLFDRMLDKAIFHGTHGDFTPVERCVQTVRSVIDVINGGDGNRPDGKGLPLFQLMISPHPEYLEGRARQGLPDYDNSVPVDYGLPSPEYQTGLTRAFEDHFDTRFASAIKDRTIRAAKDLFGGS
jgi:hypothetical protein